MRLSYNVPGLPEIAYNVVGADADRNGSGSIDELIEWLGMPSDDPFLLGKPDDFLRISFNRLYQILRKTVSVVVKLTPEGEAVIIATPALVTQPSDVAVTTGSATGVWGNFFARIAHQKLFTGLSFHRNHSTITDDGVGPFIAPWFLEEEERTGDLSK